VETFQPANLEGADTKIPGYLVRRSGEKGGQLLCFGMTKTQSRIVRKEAFTHNLAQANQVGDTIRLKQSGEAEQKDKRLPRFKQGGRNGEKCT